ncbi:hypothetical protein [Rhodanobacter sp. C03]|uniref:hypothetical protein n=1 Tax=Rhodanobacter sp. C03 TaxID=1945858 RepID=UPI000987C45C|nr:hypothetical protein [Rhodanobacter sp. C03]OOG59271.1 hypothetical protein B0E48_00010 [Rhodanobacter sp. C03]
MALFSRLNKKIVPIYLRTLAWLLLFCLLPATVYGYTESIWMGFKVFLVMGVIAALGLLSGFWGAMFPKGSGGS